MFSGSSNRSIFGGGRKKAYQENRALETESSNFEKTMRFINRPGAAIRQMDINKAKGQPLLKNVKTILKGEAEQPSGVERNVAVTGLKIPNTKRGRAAHAVAGFVTEAFDPRDPLNWIGVGAVKTGAKALQKAGKLSKFTEGLQKGERSFLSANIPFTGKSIPLSPGFVDKAAGKFFKGTGEALRSLPGVESTIKFFKPTFTKLREHANIARVTASKIAGEERVSLKEIHNIFKRAEKEIAEGGLKRANPLVDAHWDKLRLSPAEKVSAELRRLQEAPISELSKAAKAPKYVKSFLNKVPTEGPTLQSIQELAELKGKTFERLGAKKKALGIEGTIKGFAPRPASKEFLDAMEKVGIPKAKAERSIKEFTMQQAEAIAQAEKILGPKGAQRVADRVRASFFGKILGGPLKNNPSILDFFKNADPSAASVYEKNAIKAAGREIEGSAKEIATHQAVLGIVKDPSISRMRMEPGFSVKVEIPQQFRKMLSDAKKGGEKINVGHVYMNEETAHEFRNLIGIVTDADKMNGVLGLSQVLIQGIGRALAPLTNLFKEVTLLAPPGVLPYLMRNVMSNSVQSAMAGAVSKEGVAVGLRAATALFKAGDDPTKFIEAIQGLGKYKGLDLAQELATMKTANLFNEGFTREFFDPEKAGAIRKWTGIKFGGKLNETVENIGRIQHYITRRLQGWAPTAAVQDVRKYLYDYTGGLSPQLQQLKPFFPFLSWTRFNVPIMLEHLIKNPGRVALPFRAKENIENSLGLTSAGDKPDERALDEFIKGDLHIRLWQDPKTKKWTYWRLKGQIPMADLEDISSIDKFIDMSLSSLTPFVKTPLENTFNKSLFFKTAGGDRAPIEQYKGQTARFLGMDLPRKTVNIFRNVRPLAMVNKYGFGDNSLKTNAAQLTGFSVNDVDLNKATEYAKMAYKRRASELKASRAKQLKQGRSTSEVDRLFKELKEGSYVPR